MNRHLIIGLVPLALLSTTASIAMAEPETTELPANPARLDESALDTVTAGQNSISISTSSTGSSTSQVSINSTVTTSGDGVKVISKTTPDGKNTAVTLTYTIKDKNGKPQTVTEHKIIPGTKSNISVTQVPGKKPEIKIGSGPAGVFINHKPAHPVVIHTPLIPKLPHFGWWTARIPR